MSAYWGHSSPRTSLNSWPNDNNWQASTEYEGSACSVYDSAFRSQAASQGFTKWSQVNPSLFTICFTGKAKRVERCERCMSAGHRSEECSLLVEDDPDFNKRLKTIEAVVLALTRSNPTSRERSTEVCRNWNWGRCTFKGCCFSHRCTNCNGTLKQSECQSQTGPKQGGNSTPLGPTRRACKATETMMHLDQKLRPLLS